MADDSDDLLVDVADGVATITLNRPEYRNAMSAAMVGGLHEMLQDVARRTDVRVVVLTGSGDRWFCPGADLQPTADPTGSGGLTAPPSPIPLHSAVLLHEMPQVTLAAVNGACAGAGFGWAAACDLRVATSTAVFATAFLDIGVAGDMGMPWTLTNILGGARARELMFVRGRIDAAEAHRIGLVAEVFDPDGFRAGVAGIVERLRTAGPRALRTMKANFVAAERLSFADLVDLEGERHVQLVMGAEFREGVEAFRRARAQKEP